MHVKLIIVCCFCFVSWNGAAHPAYGIEMDTNGNLFFSDVLHNEGTIWKLDTKGNLTAVLTGEHCHYLYKDVHGRIWGTNHEYLPSTDSNRNTLWYLDEFGNKRIVIPPTRDVETFTGVDFTVDSNGHIYFNYQKQIYRRDSAGHMQLYIPKTFGRINALEMDYEDNLYVVDKNLGGGSVFKITPDRQVVVVADSLLEPNPPNPPFPEPRFNMFYAGFADKSGDFYVANLGSRRITRIGFRGDTSHIYHSRPPWYPVAFLKTDDAVFIMECGYIPNHGNIGPRILSLTGKEVRIVADSDRPDLNFFEEAKPVKPKRNGLFVLSLTLLAMILTVALVSRRKYRKIN